MTDDLIGRAEAQTAIQFAARRYTVAHEAHGEGQVVWSDNLINVTDAMNVLRDLPSAQPDIIHCKDCKWYGRADKRRFYRGMDCLQKRIDTIVPDRDFCSKAERREQDE